ncbi:hypothetical protein MKX03_027279 [Papaver bracteatum]|nr:hypothetical protein MKX03_027279 [Papaver bracteatum]
MGRHGPATNIYVTVILSFYYQKKKYLGNNKESYYSGLKSCLAENSFDLNNQNVKYVICQGLVVYWNFSQPESGTWSRVVENDSDFYHLPGGICYMNSEVTYLQEQLNQEKNDRQAQVFDLTIKLHKCCCCAEGGSADVEPWLNDSTDPDHWVPFEELDALSLPKNTPLAIMEGPSLQNLLNNEVTNLQNHLNHENNDKQAQVSDLTAKLRECRCWKWCMTVC